MTSGARARLANVLRGIPRVAVAVSGGVDSLTLMALAHEVTDARAYHATSAAVPPPSTERVRALAAARGWQLTVLDAGEMGDPAYLANPVDRCRVCKSHLYDAVIADVDSARTVASGTNADDLHDYRPGLDAARARGVRHPFVEASMAKADVRDLARALGLDDVAELPAQPCLSSRIETGIAIDPRMLAMVDAVETAARLRLGAGTTVRCRVRASGVFLEVDDRVLLRIDPEMRAALVNDAARAGAGAVALAPYRMGSAFLPVLG